MIDEITMELLGIDKLLADLKISTVQGKRFFENMELFSSNDTVRLKEEYDLLFKLYDFFNSNIELYNKIADYLEHIEDISFLEKKSFVNVLILEDFFLIKKFLYFFIRIYDILKEISIIKFPFDKEALIESWKILSPDGRDEFYFHFYSEYDEQLKDMRDKKNKILREIDRLKKEFVADLSKKYGIKISSHKFSLSNYFEKEKIDSLLSTGDFVILEKNFANTILGISYNENILNLEREVYSIDNKIEKIENRISIELTNKILEYKKELIQANNYIGEIDFLFAKLDYLNRYSCCKPIISGNNVSIKKGRFIYFENFLLEKGLSYQPLNIDVENNINIIVGMNMGGKTVLLKTIGFLAAHLNYGLPIPAKFAQLPIFDNIFFSTEDYHIDKSDLSSFGYELYRLNEALNLNGKKLFILDELAKGTNPYEAVALNKSFIKYFFENNIYAFISTHFNLYMKDKSISYFNMSYLKDGFFDNIDAFVNLEFTQKLQILQDNIVYQPIEISKVESVPDQAINIAHFLGINEKIIDGARKNLKEGN